MHTANPIVPNPKTATVDPGVTFAIFHADPIPEPQAKIHLFNSFIIGTRDQS